MKKALIFPIASLAILFVLFAFKIEGGVLPIGSELPKGDVKLKDITGKEISMKSARDKNGILVMFTCNTCPYVIRNQGRTKAICAYAKQHNIGVILINSYEAQRNDDDSFEAMKMYAQEQDYKWYYTADRNSEVANAFGASRTPECYLFNNGLKLTYRGAIDDSPGDPGSVTREHCKEAINEMSAGKKVSVSETRSMGCAIKRLH
ncbi:MAG: thioredoxin family protein [Ginsengibacter sp.]